MRDIQCKGECIKAIHHYFITVDQHNLLMINHNIRECGSIKCWIIMYNTDILFFNSLSVVHVLTLSANECQSFVPLKNGQFLPSPPLCFSGRQLGEHG